MRHIQFWCRFTAAQYEIPAVWRRPKRMKSATQGDAQLGDTGETGGALEPRLLASAPPVRNVGLRAAVEGRYSIAVPQRFPLPAHVGPHLTAVCGARCRW